MSTRATLTLDDFLAMPETEPPSEFVCGEVVPKPMPTFVHSLVVFAVARLFGIYLQQTGLGLVAPDTRYANRSEERAYLPDVAVLLKSRLPNLETAMRGALEVAPDIAVEVVSPDDRPGRIANKLAFYLRTGVPLVWVIDPAERTLDAYRPGQPSTTHRVPDVIDAAPVLPEFRLAVADLFAQVDELPRGEGV